MAANDREAHKEHYVSSWGYIGYSILFMIPVIGFLLLIILSFNGNRNVRNYARSYWCWLLLTVFLAAILFGLFAMGFNPDFSSIRLPDFVEQAYEEISEHLPITPISEFFDRLAERDAALSTGETTNQGVSVVPPGVTPSFKKAMDAYEAFFDEYIAFIKKMEQNPSDIQVIAEYTSFMAKYAQYMEEMEALDDDSDLSDADMAYYLEVTGRIYQKLAALY